MTRCYVQALGIVSALGEGVAATRAAVMRGDTRGMRIERDWLPQGESCVGRVTTELAPLPAQFAEDDCRNNRLLAAALRQIDAEVEKAKEQWGAHRVAVVIGTSTSGIAAGEAAMAAKLKRGEFPPGFFYRQQEIGATGPFAARLAGAAGPAYTISTACTSGAKALIAARRLLALELCDVALAGGVDTLCRLTVCGFTALESADAYHLSAPDPAGTAPEAAMRQALAEAGAAPRDIRYVNLHATATQKNDEMESRVMARLFPPETPMSGTKPLTGHALGAAGALEAAFCWLALTGEGALPPHVWDGEADPALPRLALVERGAMLPNGSGRLVMSNSFAFGGSNASLIFAD